MPNPKKDSSGKKIASLKSNVALCSRNIVNQQRQGDLEEFFSHENHSHPPISDFGRLYTGTKSDLLKLFELANKLDRMPDCLIEDGGLLLHTIQPTGSTFKDYAEDFVTYIKKMTKKCEKDGCGSSLLL